MSNGDNGLLDAEVADEQAALAAAGTLGAGEGSGGIEVRWRTSADQLSSDTDRFLNTDLQLRRVPTALPLVTQYAHLQFDDPELMTAARTKSLRRLVQVYPPEVLLKELPLGRRYMDIVVPVEAVPAIPPELMGPSMELAHHTYGSHNRDAPLNGGSPPKLFARELVLAVREQNWWAQSGVPIERVGRKETGLYRMPWWKVRERFHWNLGWGTGVPFDQLPDAVKPEFQLAVNTALANARLQTAEYGLGSTAEHGYFRHANCWEAYTRHERMRRDRDPLADLYRLVQFNTTERFAHMYHDHDLLRKPPKREGRGPEAISPEYDFCQTTVESISIEEELLDTVSTVFGEPLLLIYEQGEKLWVSVRHTELVIFASVDEFNDLRKTVDHRKQWLGLRRAEALALLALAKVTVAPDNWYLGAADDQKLRDFIFSEVVDPKIYLGYLWELAESWAQISGGDPLDYRVRPGPELGGWHLRGMQILFESFGTLLEMAEQVRNGGKISDADMRDKHLPKLVQYPKELIRWTFWDYKGNRPIRPHLTYAPGRLPHAVPYRDFALGYDWWWVMGNDHYVFLQLVAYINQRFAEAGLAVRVTCDGPDSNYFRHHDIARKIWRNQPANPLIERIQAVWNREVAKKTVHIRPVLYREVIGDLPDELLADLSTPDRLIIEDLVATTEEELRRLPRDEKEERKKLRECLKRLEQALPESKELDPLTRFIQKLNRKSDRRFRLWAAFQTHGTKGGIMGFQIGEAVATVKEGYASDTGFPDTENTAAASDLVHLGWQNPQFTKGVYLARGLSYMIATNVNPVKRHEAIGGAIIGGLHPDVAHHVAQGFGGLTKLLSLQEEAAAVRFVKDVFESQEIKRLGRTIVKEIMEGLKYRREMDQMKV